MLRRLSGRDRRRAIVWLGPTNFEASNQEITFSARFGGVPRTVRVPVEAVMAVFARENGQGMAFEPEDPPPQPSPTDPSDDDKPSKGSHLKVVK